MFKVSFAYNKLSTGIQTWAFIKKDGNVVSQGEAVCAPQDNFNKSIGRKLALARAVKLYTADKKIRKEIWSVYFDRFPKMTLEEFFEGLIK